MCQINIKNQLFNAEKQDGHQTKLVIVLNRCYDKYIQLTFKLKINIKMAMLNFVHDSNTYVCLYK